MVLGKGLEPLRLTAHAPQTCVSTNSTTRAIPNREGALRAIAQALSSPEISIRGKLKLDNTFYTKIAKAAKDDSEF